MARIQRSGSPTRHGAFTLIELLLAVTLLVLIILVSSYIFDSTMRAVSQTQANNELNISLESFSQVWRNDIRSMEHDGFLVIGGRRLEAYGTLKDRSNAMRRTFRTDWAYFYTNAEQYSSLEPRIVGQWSRTLYGHGEVANPDNPQFSNLATDWVVMRHQMLLLNKMMMSWESAGTTGVAFDDPGSAYGIETPQTGDYIGRWRQYQRSVQTYTAREFRFHWYFNYRWYGDVNVALGDTDGGGYRRAIYEPNYYHTISSVQGQHFHALAHCGQFAITYAMAEDVGVGPGGTTLWRDPPVLGQADYPDPNYRKLDPLHTRVTLPAMGEYAGRLCFGPGDRWPVLLRLEIQIYDPLDRLDGGKRLDAVVVVP